MAAEKAPAISSDPTNAVLGAATTGKSCDILPTLEGSALLQAGLTANEVTLLNAGIAGGVSGLISGGNLKEALLKGC